MSLLASIFAATSSNIDSELNFLIVNTPVLTEYRRDFSFLPFKYHNV